MMLKNPFSIRSDIGIRKRIYLVLLIILVPFLILETFIFYGWFQARKEMELQANLELARAVAKNFETYVHGLTDDQLTLGLALTGSLPLPDQDRDNLIDKIKAVKPEVRSIFLLNPEGLVVASSLRSYIGFNLADRSYFRKVIEGQDWAISELIIGKATGKPAFTVSRAIRDVKGKLLFVVAASIEPDRLDDVLGIVRARDAGVSLIDNKGMHVYRYPPTDYTWEQRDWLKFIPMLKESLEGREVTTEVIAHRTGVKRLAALVPVPSTGWVASTSRAENEGTAAIIKALLPHMGLASFVTLMAFAAAFGLSQPITRSISQLRDHIAAFGRGEIERTFVDGPIEVKGLAQTFEQMIVKRKQSEEALRESEERFRIMADGLPLYIWVHDAEGRQQIVNQTFCEFFGVTREEIKDGRWKILIHPEDADAYASEFMACVRDQRIFHGQARVKRADGQWRWIESWGRLRMNSMGQYLGHVGASIDITERKNAEQELKQWSLNLEQRVAERTEIAERRSKQLQALAVELTEAEEQERRRIAQLLHDDLQQILASARMQLEVACESLPPTPLIGSVCQMLRESVLKARRLSHELSPAVLHQSGILTALQWLASKMHEQFGLQVQIETGVEDQSKKSKFDSFIFRSIQELLFNINKHADVKDAIVRFAVSNGNYIVTVLDKGKGFDTSKLNSFDPQIGFGLLTIRERANHVGGNLLIESEVGQGSSFTLTVPVIEHKRVDSNSSDASSGHFDAISETAKTALRVLFVDDHKIMRQGLIKIMGGQPGIQVIGEASNGLEAIEIARQLRPDLIVMDISMPDLDGIEATKIIKSEMPKIRIIGLTMHDDEKIIKQMLSAGAEAVLNKTASTSELLKSIY